MTTIEITTAGRAVTAVLDDSTAADVFARMLPLEVTLTDFHGTEKVANLPAPLPTEGAPEGYEPAAGDLTYYAPWGNLALFYSEFDYSRGLVRLGEVASGDASDLDRLAGPASIRVVPS